MYCEPKILHYYFMLNLAIRWMPSTFLALRCTKRSPVLWVPVAQMFSSDKNGKTPPSKLPKTTTEKIADSASPNSGANSDSTKGKAVAETGNAQAGKETKEKGGDVTATIENRGVADSAEKKESVASGAAEKLGQTEKKTGGQVREQSSQNLEMVAAIKMLAENQKILMKQIKERTGEEDPDVKKWKIQKEKIGLFGIFAAIGAFFVAVFQYIWSVNNSDKKNRQAAQKQLCNKYCKQDLEAPKHFVPETSIEKQIEVSIKRQYNWAGNLVDFLIGVPGTGKTTAIKNIVTKMREEKKEDIYYFSLRSEDDSRSKGGIQTKVAELFNLIRAISNNREGKKVRVVIDDINYLEQSDQRRDMEILIPELVSSSTHVIVVSSSSSYAKIAMSRQLGKKSRLQIINTPSLDELKKLFNSLFLRLKDSLQESSANRSVPLEQKQEALRKAEKFAYEAGLPLRQLQNYLLTCYQYENLEQKIKQMSQKLKENKQNEINTLITNIKFQSELMGRNEYLYRLMELIVNSPEQIDDENVLRIIRPFRQMNDILQSKASKFLDDLENGNILIYGKARYGLYQKILEEQRDKYKLQWDEEKKAKANSRGKSEN